MALSKSVLGRLRYQQETIGEIISGLPEVLLKHRVYPGKWSAFENIVHLTAYQPTFIHRIDLMLHREEPIFERYVADNDPRFHEYLQRPLADLMSQISADRFVICSILEEQDDQALKRTGRHSAYGLITIAGWSDFFLLHEAHHLWTLFQLTRSLLVLNQ
jgi:hypothetical protein